MLSSITRREKCHSELVSESQNHIIVRIVKVIYLSQQKNSSQNQYSNSKVI